MQIGGSDQWGNITTGIEMIRKLYGDNNEACGLTISLLTKSDGTKFGKSEKGAIYLDKKYTSPFAMYQFLFNQPDSDVEKLLKFLTLLKQDEINAIMQKHKVEPFKRLAQQELSKVVLADIHGVKEYEHCLQISEAFYKGAIESLSNDDLYNALTSVTSFDTIEPSYNIIDLLTACGVCKSKSEARTLLESNAIAVNNKPINKFDTIISKSHSINGKFSYIKKGKKSYFLIN
jgi:tyrosyl-tRNA synthetase